MLRWNKPDPTMKRKGSFHLLAYSGLNSATGSTSGFALTAAVDPEFSQRNGHYLFSEQYYLIMDALYGSQALRGRISAPTLNAIAPFNIWPMNESTVSASPPRADFFFDDPIMLPQNEEIAPQVDTSGADTISLFMQIGPPNWKDPIPSGMAPVPLTEIRFTCTNVVGNAGAWSTLAQMSLEQSLRGGTYAVVGLQVQGTNLLAARLVFPQNKFVNGRRLRPGVLSSQTIGDLPVVFGKSGAMVYGEMGRFTTWELPQVEAFMIGTGTITLEGRLHIVRLSDSVNIRYGTAGPY